MITFIKKVKTKEGINTTDLEKIKKHIPSGFKATGEPVVTYTANHMVIAYKCAAVAKPAIIKVKSRPKAQKAVATKANIGKLK